MFSYSSNNLLEQIRRNLIEYIIYDNRFCFHWKIKHLSSNIYRLKIGTASYICYELKTPILQPVNKEHTF